MVNIPGRILDARYCGMLIRNAALTLQEIVLLDRVQKGAKIEKDAIKHLRKRGLVEGRVTNLMIAAKVAEETGQKVEYIKIKATNDVHLRQLILDYLNQWGKASRKELEDLLFDKMSMALTLAQKRTKLSTLLTALRRKGMIANVGSDKMSHWTLQSKNENPK